MAELIDLEARISALEMIVVTHILQSGVGTVGFDPTMFARSRRDAWAAVGRAVCEGCSSEAEEKHFAEAYARALERIGQLLVVLAEPVQEAVDEVLNAPSSGQTGGSTLEDVSAQQGAEIKERTS